MTKLNKTTKKAKQWIRAYNNSNYYNIESFYTRPSYNKIRIEQGLKEKMCSIRGHGYRVLSGNSSFFTCGYLSSDKKHLYIETFANTFEIEL